MGSAVDPRPSRLSPSRMGGITMTKAEDREWHLDKKVPIALIVTIALTFGGQAITFTIWATRLDNRVASLEQKDNDRNRQADKLNEIAVNIATLTARAESTNQQLSDVKRNVESLTQQVLQEKTRR